MPSSGAGCPGGGLPPAPGTPERRVQGHPVGPAFARGSRPRALRPPAASAGTAGITAGWPRGRYAGCPPRPRSGPAARAVARRGGRAPTAHPRAGTPTRALPGRRPELPAPRAARGGAPTRRRAGAPTALALAVRRRLAGAPGGDRPWGAHCCGPAPSPGGPWGSPRPTGPPPGGPSGAGPATGRPGIDSGIRSYGAGAPASSPSRHRDGQCSGRRPGF